MDACCVASSVHLLLDSSDVIDESLLPVCICLDESYVDVCCVAQAGALDRCLCVSNMLTLAGPKFCSVRICLFVINDVVRVKVLSSVHLLG